MDRPTVLIAEDDVLIREGLLRFLLEPDFNIQAAVENGEEAISAAAAQHPELILLDISLPGISGLEAAQTVLRTQPECKILFVSGHADPSYIEAARKLGASGYVLKTRLQRELLPAIRTVLSGQHYWSQL